MICPNTTTRQTIIETSSLITQEDLETILATLKEEHKNGRASILVSERGEDKIEFTFPKLLF